MKLSDIKKIAVLGAGTMGPGIAMSYAAHGFEVQIWSHDPELIPAAKSVIKNSLETMNEFGYVSQAEIPNILGRIKYCDELEQAVAGAQYVLEVIVENRDAKRALYKKLDAICDPKVIIVSNTSVLNIFDLMPENRLPNTIIAHWFAPPHVIPLVEVVKGDKTADETVKFVMDILEKIGKEPVLINKYVPGFIINRLQLIMNKEVFYLLDNGYVSAEHLDRAVKASLAPRMMVLGLVQRMDFTGLDMSANNLKNQEYIQPPEDPRPKSLFDRVARGELGVKTGRGFFDYSGQKREDLLRERDKKILEVLTCAKKWK